MAPTASNTTAKIERSVAGVMMGVPLAFFERDLLRLELRDVVDRFARATG
jgi:hypothetical protein